MTEKKPKHWLARSNVDRQNMNQLFADYGIWYANSETVRGSLKNIARGDFIALVKHPNMIHALGKVADIKTAHEIGDLPAGGKNDLRIFFIENTDGGAAKKGWGKLEPPKKAPYTLRRSLQQVTDEAHIKAIWGNEE